MKIVEISEDNFKKEVLESDMPVLVDFNAEWCGPCKMLKPILEEISEFRADFKIGSINVDNEIDLSKEYGIISIPCLIVFKDGKEVSRSVGFKSKEAIESMMEEI